MMPPPSSAVALGLFLFVALGLFLLVAQVVRARKRSGIQEVSPGRSKLTELMAFLLCASRQESFFFPWPAWGDVVVAGTTLPRPSWGKGCLREGV